MGAGGVALVPTVNCGSQSASAVLIIHLLLEPMVYGSFRPWAHASPQSLRVVARMISQHHAVQLYSRGSRGSP